MTHCRARIPPPKRRIKTPRFQEPFEFQIDETFMVSEVGQVVGGLLTRGMLHEGSQVKIGPLNDASFKNVTIQSVHRNKVPCKVVHAGQSAALSLDSNIPGLRRGMVLLPRDHEAVSCFFFQVGLVKNYLKIHILLTPVAGADFGTSSRQYDFPGFPDDGLHRIDPTGGRHRGHHGRAGHSHQRTIVRAVPFRISPGIHPSGQSSPVQRRNDAGHRENHANIPARRKRQENLIKFYNILSVLY